MEKSFEQHDSINPDCVKVVFFGPESTGKSVMAKQLSQEFSEPYVKEFSRIYAEEKQKQGLHLTKLDVMPIAAGQMALENQQLKSAKELLICDTDLLQTKVYSEQYYQGFCPPELDYHAFNNRYDCYFLCYIDTIWELDGIRDRPDDREEMFEAFENALKESDKPFIVLKGSLEEKLDSGRNKINELLKIKV